MLIGNRLKDLRIERGISAEQLAAELEIGVAMVFRYENNKSDPSSQVLTKIARYFKVSTDYLVGLARDPHPPDPAPYLDYDWPPATTDELRLMDETRKGNFEDAAKLLIEMHRQWLEHHGFDLTNLK